jgi:outer membrane protein assembly factor BamB
MGHEGHDQLIRLKTGGGVMVRLWFLGAMIVTVGCVSKRDELQSCYDHVSPCRPMRAEVMEFSPELDAIKPLAPIDVSGWVLASDVLIGTLSNRWLVGISIKDQKVLWWFETPSGVTNPLSVMGSWVLVGLRDGRLLKVEALTGKKVWETQLRRFVARPLVLGGATLVAVTANQQVYAVDFQSGNILWMYDAGEPDNLSIRTGAPAIVRDKRVFVGTDKGELHAISLDQGRLEWRYNPAYTDDRFHDVIGEIVSIGNQIVVSRYDGLVAAISVSGPEPSVLWKDTLPAITSNSFRSSILFLGCINGDVYAVDALSGRRIWRAPTVMPIASLSPGEKVLYSAGTNGRISALDMSNGNILWQDDVDGAIDAPPVLFKDRIYFGTGLKALYGFRLL